MIRTLPRRHCRIYIADTQTCLEALNQLGACKTRNEFLRHHWKCVHYVNISNDYAKKLFLILRISNLTDITTLAPV